jgi:glycosyltransferase involved in cell wall biosynthesis
MRSLYLTYSGMTEPLGRSQVLPYLFGLARAGVSFDLVSFEPAGTDAKHLKHTRELIQDNGIRWHPTVRSARHNLPTKLWESSLAVLAAIPHALRQRPQILHSRHYLTTASADIIASAMPNTRLLFDCRGMMGDEYVASGHWTEDRIEYKLLKRVERRLFRRAEGVVVLTARLAEHLRNEHAFGPKTLVEVVPCCVDEARYASAHATRDAARSELGLPQDAVVVAYSGTLGSWYLEREMAEFFAKIRRESADARCLILSRDKPTTFLRELARLGVPETAVVARAVHPEDMPKMLSAGDIGLSFIKPGFSKLGSSPTKVAEYLAAGLVVVLNSHIGDQRELTEHTDACVVLDDFTTEAFATAAKRAITLTAGDRVQRAAATRAVVAKRFSMRNVGVPTYLRLYEALVAAPKGAVL